MPKINIQGGQSFEVETGTRLVVALQDNGLDILHRCGGHARCTTCRVTFSAGEPSKMTVAEYEKLKERELLGQVRLSCQITCDHDMTVTSYNSLAESTYSDPGGQPEADITPAPVWMDTPK